MSSSSGISDSISSGLTNYTAVADEDQVNPYYVAWISFQTVLVCSFLLSGSTFLLTHFHAKIRQAYHAQLIQYLTGQNTIWSLCCLVQCAINSHYGYFYGGYAACEVQSMYMLFFILMNGYTLCLMAYSSERRVQLARMHIGPDHVKQSAFYHKWMQSSESMLVWHCIGWLVAALLSLGTSLLITPAELEPSDTFCFLSLQNRFNSILFFSPLVAFGVFLAHRYYGIFQFVVEERRRSLMRVSRSDRPSHDKVIPIAKQQKHKQQHGVAQAPSRASQQSQHSGQPSQSDGRHTPTDMLTDRKIERLEIKTTMPATGPGPPTTSSFSSDNSSDKQQQQQQNMAHVGPSTPPKQRSRFLFSSWTGSSSPKKGSPNGSSNRVHPMVPSLPLANLTDMAIPHNNNHNNQLSPILSNDSTPSADGTPDGMPLAVVIDPVNKPQAISPSAQAPQTSSSSSRVVLANNFLTAQVSGESPGKAEGQAEGQARPEFLSAKMNQAGQESTIVGTPSSSSQFTNLQRIEKRLAKRMLLFVISYVLCCFPAALISFCQLISSSLWISSNPIFYLVAAHLVHLAPILNPILYVWLNPYIRRYIVELLTNNCILSIRVDHIHRTSWVQMARQQQRQGRQHGRHSSEHGREASQASSLVRSAIHSGVQSLRRRYSQLSERTKALMTFWSTPNNNKAQEPIEQKPPKRASTMMMPPRVPPLVEPMIEPTHSPSSIIKHDRRANSVPNARVSFLLPGQAAEADQDDQKYIVDEGTLSLARQLNQEEAKAQESQEVPAPEAQVPVQEGQANAHTNKRKSSMSLQNNRKSRSTPTSSGAKTYLFQFTCCCLTIPVTLHEPQSPGSLIPPSSSNDPSMTSGLASGRTRGDGVGQQGNNTASSASSASSASLWRFPKPKRLPSILLRPRALSLDSARRHKPKPLTDVRLPPSLHSLSRSREKLRVVIDSTNDKHIGPMSGRLRSPITGELVRMSPGMSPHGWIGLVGQTNSPAGGNTQTPGHTPLRHKHGSSNQIFTFANPGTRYSSMTAYR